MKKHLLKQLALQRVKALINSSLQSEDEYIDNRIDMAKKIILKYKLVIPYEYKILFCKNCKKFIIPGKNSRIRTGRTNTKAVRITCGFCGHTYRKIINNKNNKNMPFKPDNNKLSKNKIIREI